MLGNYNKKTEKIIVFILQYFFSKKKKNVLKSGQKKYCYMC